MVVGVDLEGRNALIGGGEAAFFWIAWRQASRLNAKKTGRKRDKVQEP